MTKTSSMRPCAVCGTEFRPACNRQATCSPDCRKKQRRRINRAAYLRRREAAAAKSPLPDRPCAACGRPFAPVRANQICCSPACAAQRHNDCRRAYYHSHRKEIIRSIGAKNASLYRASSRLKKVPCRCPRCGQMHDVRMTPVRPGFTPRIYCNRCETAVAHMAEHRDLAYESGNAVGYW